MTESGTLAEVLARFGDQRTVLRHLKRSELRERVAEDFADVRLRGVSEDQTHGLLPERFGFGFVQEGLEPLVGFELRTVEAKRFHAFIAGSAKQPGVMCDAWQRRKIEIEIERGEGACDS